jgi:hypothetical protein
MFRSTKGNNDLGGAIRAEIHGRLRTGGEVRLCVGSENDRHMKQPRPRANAIALYLRD